MLQVNVMRKYLSSRCRLGVGGERWWVTHDPSGLPDLTRLMNSVLTRTSSLLLCLHSLFLSLTTSNFSLFPPAHSPGDWSGSSRVVILIPAEPLKYLTICRLPWIYNYHHITFKLGSVALLHNLTPIYQRMQYLRIDWINYYWVRC